MVVIIKTWQLKKSAEMMRHMDEETLSKGDQAALLVEELVEKLTAAGIEEVMFLADSGSSVG